MLSKKWKINKTVKLIKFIKSTNVKGGYSLSEAQVLAILDLRLQKLTAFGINEIEIEIKKLSELIKKYEKMLKSKKVLLDQIVDELQKIKGKFLLLFWNLWF